MQLNIVFNYKEGKKNRQNNESEGRYMTKEEKILLIVRNSDFTYEELEKLPMSSIDSIYRAHVLEKNGG